MVNFCELCQLEIAMFAFARALVASRPLVVPALSALAVVNVNPKANPMLHQNLVPPPGLTRQYQEVLVPKYVAQPAQCGLDDTLDKLLKRFDVPVRFGSYMETKGLQAGHLAQIDEKDTLHTLLTEKVNARSEPPLEGDDYEFLELKVEALWKASKTHFSTQMQQESQSNSPTLRLVSSGEKTAKIKAYEIRNNAIFHTTSSTK